jgi:N-acetylglucosamine-6-phosphate deacetylase
MTVFAIVGARVVQPHTILKDQAVIVENGRIRELCSVDSLPKNLDQHRVEGLLAPGFIDVQVNGGGGVLFNETTTIEGIRAIGAAHRKFGTTGFLPTLITDTREKMAAAVEATRQGLAAGIPGLLGIHLEGPFLNPERKGVHDPKYMRPIENEDFRIMTSLGAGRTMVTLAPEMVPMDAISRLAKAGVIVSAGHTAASYELLQQARKHGLRGYTHLFNAMPPLMGREPGPVGAALDDDSWCSLIVDLHHVSAASLRVAVQAKGGSDRLMLVTDAMPSVGTSLETFEIQGRTIFRREGRLTTADGTLAGSDLDMATAVRNTLRHLRVLPPTAFQWASGIPASFLRLEGEVGEIRAGCLANFVLLDDDTKVRSTWIDGVEERVSG